MARIARDQRIARASAMIHALYLLFSALRSLFWFVPVWLNKLLPEKSRDREFAAQRMCPFCGLITARHKRRCLECGKSLKPA
jgi:hypothetical protein